MDGVGQEVRNVNLRVDRTEHDPVRRHDPLVPHMYDRLQRAIRCIERRFVDRSVFENRGVEIAV